MIKINGEIKEMLILVMDVTNEIKFNIMIKKH